MRVRVCGPGATPVENIVHVGELHVHIDPGTTCWSDSGESAIARVQPG